MFCSNSHLPSVLRIPARVETSTCRYPAVNRCRTERHKAKVTIIDQRESWRKKKSAVGSPYQLFSVSQNIFNAPRRSIRLRDSSVTECPYRSRPLSRFSFSSNEKNEMSTRIRTVFRGQSGTSPLAANK